jgi:hypothetical protein
LIARFLEEGPCKEAAHVLQQELHTHGLLARTYTCPWRGQWRAATYSEAVCQMRVPYDALPSSTSLISHLSLTRYNGLSIGSLSLSRSLALSIGSIGSKLPKCCKQSFGAIAFTIAGTDTQQ